MLFFFFLNSLGGAKPKKVRLSKGGKRSQPGRPLGTTIDRIMDRQTAAAEEAAVYCMARMGAWH